MCYGDRSRNRTGERTANSEDAEETRERKELPSKGIVNTPVRAVKRAYAMVTSL